MIKQLCQWLLYKRMGWTKEVTVAHPAKYIICLAPHTSNWDFIIGQLYAKAEGLESHFLMKKEWFFWPLGILFRAMGGIPVWRDGKHSLTDLLAEEAKRRKSFHLCITPEGTRARREEWKLGFYFIAQKANIPILLYGLDFAHRRIVCTKSVLPTGKVDEEVRDIKRYFLPFQGKHPERFTTGLEQTASAHNVPSKNIEDAVSTEKALNDKKGGETS